MISSFHSDKQNAFKFSFFSFETFGQNSNLAQCAKRTLLSTGGGARTSIENWPSWTQGDDFSFQAETRVLGPLPFNLSVISFLGSVLICSFFQTFWKWQSSEVEYCKKVKSSSPLRAAWKVSLTLFYIICWFARFFTTLMTLFVYFLHHYEFVNFTWNHLLQFACFCSPLFFFENV